MGGGVRVGLEDNIYLDRNRKQLGTNISFLKRIHNLAEIFERKIMTPSELRRLLGLKSGFGNYGCA
jgi:uncharacterized protein (DUF849 family)